MHKVNHKSQAVITIVASVIGIALLVIGGLGLWDYFQTTHTGIDTPSTNETITETATVSEKPIVVKDDAYVVPADKPRTIKIPKLDINAYVQKVGIEKSGAMSTPNNINFAGWYVNGPSPGQPGVSIINGHAGGRYSVGIFRHIEELISGDTIQVQMGDMSLRDFSVVSVATYSVAEAATPLFNDDPSIDEELHLITCDGIFDNHLKSYDKRTIVVAKHLHQ